MNQPERPTENTAGFRARITAVILAGGRGERMAGRDKGLVEIAGQSLLARVARILAPQTGQLLISANRNLSEYRRYGYEVIEDAIENFAGPLAGMLSAMNHCDTDFILTVPCDAPLLPPDYCERMYRAMEAANGDACVAHDGRRLQPMYALLHHEHRQSLQRFLDEGNHRVHDWFASLAAARADFSDHPEQFYNMNTPGDKERLEKLLENR